MPFGWGSFVCPKVGDFVPYIRVRDKSTRHEFDVPDSDWRIEAGLFEQVKPSQYPAAAVLRPAKHFVASKGVASKPSVAADNKEAN